jgi:hypothetical protein
VSSHRSTSRVIREIHTPDGRVVPVLGMGFGLSEIDDEAQQTCPRRNLPRRAHIESTSGQLICQLSHDTSAEDACAYRDRHFPQYRVVLWAADPWASDADASQSGHRRVFESKFATVAKSHKPASKGQLRRAGIKRKRK